MHRYGYVRLGKTLQIVVPKSRHANRQTVRIATVVAAFLCGPGMGLVGVFVEPPVFDLQLINDATQMPMVMSEVPAPH
jgi:hypothetical protein